MDQDAVEFWDNRYAEREQIWSGNPNAVLVDVVADMTPKTALDLGCGEGADAIWLASQGWDVTGLDISERALDRARIAAIDHGFADITWMLHDLSSAPISEKFDLVSALFLQSPIEFPRERILNELTQAVLPLGHLLIVGHAQWPPWSRHAQAGHDHGPGHGNEHEHEQEAPPSAAQVLDSLDIDQRDWTVVICEDRPRPATGPNCEQVELLDSIVLLQRTNP